MEITILIIITALVIQTLLLIYIISTSTQTHRKVRQAEINNRLLTLIARKLNATEQEIGEAWRV